MGKFKDRAKKLATGAVVITTGSIGVVSFADSDHTLSGFGESVARNSGDVISSLGGFASEHIIQPIGEFADGAINGNKSKNDPNNISAVVNQVTVAKGDTWFMLLTNEFGFSGDDAIACIGRAGLANDLLLPDQTVQKPC